MPDPRVVYEVNLSIEPEIEEAFAAWLPGHVEDMLALPGFIDAKILRDDEPDAAGRSGFTVHYTLSDRRALDRYFDEHAERMRADGIERFGDKFSATRRVLGKAAPGAARADLTCRNCNAPLSGQYCHECGQRDTHRMISLYELLRDFVGDLFELDSRVWRTLWPLLFRPGHLTVEYLRGRRVRFTPPLRLYLVLSLVFFVLALLNVDVGSGDGFSINLNDTVLTDSGEFAPDETARRFGPERCDEINVEDDLFGTDAAEVTEFLRRTCHRHGGDPARLISAFVGHIPQMMFVFLPLIALAMKILYIGSRRYYVEHLLFVVHVHSFVYLLLTIMILAGKLPVVWAWQGAAAEALSTAAIVYILYYVFRSLRVVYRQGRVFTLFKYVLLILAYFVSLLVMFVLGLLATLLFG